MLEYPIYAQYRLYTSVHMLHCSAAVLHMHSTDYVCAARLHYSIAKLISQTKEHWRLMTTKATLQEAGH